MADLKTDVATVMERIPTVARLYYTGLGTRRYRRASVLNGPGEALVHRSHVERELTRLLAERAPGEKRGHRPRVDRWREGA